MDVSTDQSQQRSIYWDSVKGLGIIAIVFGHCRFPLTRYLFLYHVALFFFVSGCMYKEKHSSDPFAYFANRLKRLWWPMIQYGVLFALLHNTFLRVGLYYDKPVLPTIDPMGPYNLLELFMAIKGTVLMQSLERMGRYMWFLQPLIITMALFCCIRKVSGVTEGWKKEALSFVMVILGGVLGIVLIKNDVKLEYHSDLALLVLPVVYVGFQAHRHWNQVPMKWYYALLSITALIIIDEAAGRSFDLSHSVVIGPKAFYLATFSGIYLNLYLAELIKPVKLLVQVIAYLGRRSLHIMALHLLSFKIISYAYVLVYDQPVYLNAARPGAIFPFCWIPYSVVGLLVPVLLVESYERVRAKVAPLLKHGEYA